MSANAKREVEKMKSSLRSWLAYRERLDAAADGSTPGKFPPETVRAIVAAYRDSSVELNMARELHALLSQVVDPSTLPSPTSEDAAVKFARLVVNGSLESSVPTPQAQGIWPLVILAGAIVLTLVVAVRSWADVAKEREHYACIRAGACTDYGAWLKWGVIFGVGYVVWTQTDLKNQISGIFGKAGRATSRAIARRKR